MCMAIPSRVIALAGEMATVECFGVVFLVVAFAQPGEGLFFKIPQWILFIPVGLLGLWGAVKKHLPA